MATITKLHRSPLGDFTITFSIKFGRFEISNYPEGVFNKVGGSLKALKTWEDVNEELDRIQAVYLTEVLFTRKVIIIDLQTSESTFEVIKKKWMGEGTEKVRTEDFMNAGMGFILKWYVAEEYEYPAQHQCGSKSPRYKIIESANNCGRYLNGRIDILGQIFHKNVRVIEYREDLHNFLKNLDGVVKEMLQKLVAYFDIDPAKFLQNFEQGQFKLLGK